MPIKRLKTLAEKGLNFPLPPLAVGITTVREAVPEMQDTWRRGYPDVTRKKLVLDLGTFGVLPLCGRNRAHNRRSAPRACLPSGRSVLAASRTVARKAFNDEYGRAQI